MFAKVLVLFTLAAAAPQSLDTFKIINGQIQSSAPASAKAVAQPAPAPASASAAQDPVTQAAPVASAAAPAAQGNANSGIASQIATSARTIQNDVVNFQQDVSLVKPKTDADNIKLQNILNQLSSVVTRFDGLVDDCLN